jgi:TatD DNase family protein
VIDTHCHLTHARFAADAAEVIARARAAGVEACLTIGTGIADALAAHDLSRAHPGIVHAAAGLDPFSSHAAGERFDAALDALEALHREAGFAAVGEIGLDYHYDLDPRPVQAARFERQLDLARSLDRPVIIHVREAHDDLAAILAAHPGHRGVIHSFTAGPAEAERYLALGWHLGFGGVATFRNAEAVREASRLTPLDRLLVETDAPYLAPVPHRGERCEPRHVAVTLAALASVRGVTAEELDAATTANARRLFGWPA